MNRPFFRVIILSISGVFLQVAADVGAQSVDGRVEFRTPRKVTYRLEQVPGRQSNVKQEWIKAWPENGSTNSVEFSSRIVLQLKSAKDLNELIDGRPLQLSRTVNPGLFILQAPDAMTAMVEAQRLASLPEVLASYPVMRRHGDLHGPYAPLPTDNFFFPYQWNLEHRNGDGSSAGMDLNVRAAWPYTLGQGSTIAVVDTGIEMTHTELVSRLADAPHYNFEQQSTNVGPINRFVDGAHGTEVAGLAAASINNARIVGVAPGAAVASWVIFVQGGGGLASEEHLMDMYQYKSNIVSVENHSWGHGGLAQDDVGLLEQAGISNAVTLGRSGCGVVMVRSAGNDRPTGANANDDGYTSDPRVITVAAARFDGRVANYSEPGACILVGAPSGEPNTSAPGLFTTDLIGTDGANPYSGCPFFDPNCPNKDLPDYDFYNQFTATRGFSGTSAAAPQISGVVALILSANTNLTYRDVQQILILSSRHFDFADPDLVRNGAGFLVSHNLGFGVPDAGAAVNLARIWPNRPALTHVTVTATNAVVIPDDGLRLLITGDNIPTNLTSIHTKPSVGPHADTPTPALPLVDIGLATNVPPFSLTNKGALIVRGVNNFDQKIMNAAQAGAAFAIVYNYTTNVSADGGDQLVQLGVTDFVPIPAVMIGNSNGITLTNLFLTNASALAQIHLDSTNYVFTVTNTLICEHVGVRVMADHPARGDLRITLVSPSGTRSVLQRYVADPTPGPTDWTYYSTHHFYESSAGNWTLYVSDEGADNSGSVLQAALTIYGTQIYDSDKDGLRDIWEKTYFGDLSKGPNDDPDKDGYSNAREQILSSNPNFPSFPLKLDMSFWNQNIIRLSWPSSTNFNYEVWSGTDAASLTMLTNVAGSFPETEWFTGYNISQNRLYKLRAVPAP